MPVERRGAFCFQENPLTLVGPEMKVGDRAPNFKALGADMSEVTFDTARDRVRLLLSLPSLDTSVCDAETRRFNEVAKKFPEDVVIYAISCDLPFALNRWCGAAGVDRIQTLSDHRELSFGQAYGTYIKEWRMLSRAVFVVDKNGAIQYVEYVPEIGQHPDYDAVHEIINRL